MNDPREILENSTTVAVVGISQDVSIASGRVPATLKEWGFRIIPVDPTSEEILGQKAYATLDEVSEQVDVVQVFRAAEEAGEIARQAVNIGAKTLWLQKGIKSPEARQVAEEAGLGYVEDRCMGADANRLNIRKETPIPDRS